MPCGAQPRKLRSKPNMDVWSWVLLSIGALVAVTSLVGLMRRKRDEVLAELTVKAKEEQHKKRLAEQEEARQKKKKRVS